MSVFQHGGPPSLQKTQGCSRCGNLASKLAVCERENRDLKVSLAGAEAQITQMSEAALQSRVEVGQIGAVLRLWGIDKLRRVAWGRSLQSARWRLQVWARGTFSALTPRTPRMALARVSFHTQPAVTPWLPTGGHKEPGAPPGEGTKSLEEGEAAQLRAQLTQLQATLDDVQEAIS